MRARPKSCTSSRAPSPPALEASSSTAASLPNNEVLGVVSRASEDGTLELDLYAGYEASINDDLSWNAGLVWYTYPGSDNTATRSKISSYPELSAGVDWKGLGLKQWLAIDYGGSNDTALYTEANYTFPLPQNFSFTLHAGYNWGDAFDGFEYLDYGATIGVDVGKFSLALKLTGTDNSGADKVTDDVFNNEARVLFQISTTFPWSE